MRDSGSLLYLEDELAEHLDTQQKKLLRLLGNNLLYEIFILFSNNIGMYNEKNIYYNISPPILPSPQKGFCTVSLNVEIVQSLKLTVLQLDKNCIILLFDQVFFSFGIDNYTAQQCIVITVTREVKRR